MFKNTLFIPKQINPIMYQKCIDVKSSERDELLYLKKINNLKNVLVLTLKNRLNLCRRPSISTEILILKKLGIEAFLFFYGKSTSN